MNILIKKLIILCTSFVFLGTCKVYKDYDTLKSKATNNPTFLNFNKIVSCKYQNGFKFNYPKFGSFNDTIRNRLIVYTSENKFYSIDLTMDWIVDSFEIFKFKDESEIKIHNYDEYIIVSSNQRIWVLEPIHFGLIANLIDTINEFIPVNNGILYSFIEVGI